MSEAEAPRAHTPDTEGRRAWGFRRRGVLALLCVVPALALSLLLEPCVRPGSALDVVLAALGWAAFLAGTALRFAATLFVGGRKRKELVVDGPYAACRNPLYLATFLVGLSAALFLGAPLLLAGVLLAALLTALVTVPAEERDLAELHGGAFAAYCREVPRFWPRWSRFRAPPTVPVQWHGLALEARRFLLWAWLPFAARLVVLLREQAWWPRLSFFS
jgi:protein-S-isoprenylcysteine O-methyltransferase Ste14